MIGGMPVEPGRQIVQIGGGEPPLVIPMFNNISTNSNINSPGASSTSRQTFGLNAP
ncbi:hypothetical protein [Streptomyces sp. NPDC056527]|uniref:hypothetical protein n=1 Tax=Streptomyces sp. NPDC056527 TaxID=3345853 RepID=UPI0036B9F9E3